jgi:hypothetical protein
MAKAPLFVKLKEPIMAIVKSTKAHISPKIDFFRLRINFFFLFIIGLSIAELTNTSLGHPP